MPTPKNPALQILGGAGAIVLASVSPTVSAQDQFTIDEVIVTAQKREQNLQDIGVSVSAFTGEQLEKLGVTRVEDVVELSAGVQMNNTNGNLSPTFVIRGIGIQDFNGNSAPAASVHIDEIYMASSVNSGPQLFDLERIEILKGPQGTLFGRNNTAGTVNIVSRKPAWDRDAHTKIGYGRFDNLELEGAIGGPLTERVAYRVAVRTEKSNGFFDNGTFAPGPVISDPDFPGPGTTPLPPGTDGDLGDIDIWALRGQLLFEPNPDLSILLNAHGAWDNSGQAPVTVIGTGATTGIVDSEEDFVQSPCPSMGFNPLTGSPQGGNADPSRCVDAGGFSDPDPESDFDVSNDFVGNLDNAFYGGFVKVNWETAPGTLTSITAYEAFDTSQALDGDGSSNVLDHVTPFDQDLRQWSQELRFNANQTEDWYWLVGLYASYDEYESFLRLRLDLDGNPANGSGFCNFSDLDLEPGGGSCAQGLGLSGPPVPADGLTFAEQNTTTAAIFTHHEWRLNEAIKLIFGFRYTWEQREFESISFWEYGEDPSTRVVIDTFGPARGGTGPAVTDDDFTTIEPSWRLGLDWTPSNNTLVFAALARGFKSGGWDANIVVDAALLEPYDEETVDALELGVKSDWADNRLRFNATAFVMRYDKPQLRKNILIGGLPNSKLDNIDKADHRGLELELTWLPVAGLSLMASASFLDTETRDSDPLSADPREFDNKELPYAPNQAYSLLARYEWEVAESLIMSLQASASHTGDHYLDTLNVAFEEQDYTLVDARLGLAAREGDWNLTFWGKNLTDETFRQGVFPLFSSRNFYLNRPRSYGVSFTYHWGG